MALGKKLIKVIGATLVTLTLANTVSYGVVKIGLEIGDKQRNYLLAKRLVREYPSEHFFVQPIRLGRYLACKEYLGEQEGNIK